MDELSAPQSPPQPRLEDLYADLNQEAYNQLLLPQGNIPLLNRQNLILPQKKKEEVLEKVFVASSSPDESDWFVLDDAGRRVMKNKSPKVVSEEPEVVSEEPAVTEVSAVERDMQEGGFFPIELTEE